MRSYSGQDSSTQLLRGPCAVRHCREPVRTARGPAVTSGVQGESLGAQPRKRAGKPVSVPLGPGSWRRAPELRAPRLWSSRLDPDCGGPGRLGHLVQDHSLKCDMKQVTRYRSRGCKCSLIYGACLLSPCPQPPPVSSRSHRGVRRAVRGNS